MDIESEATNKKAEKAQQLEQNNQKLVQNIQNLDDGVTKNPHLSVNYQNFPIFLKILLQKANLRKLNDEIQQGEKKVKM